MSAHSHGAFLSVPAALQKAHSPPLTAAWGHIAESTRPLENTSMSSSFTVPANELASLDALFNEDMVLFSRICA